MVSALSALAKSLPPERAADLLNSPAKTLAEAFAKQTEPYARGALAPVLAELAKSLPPERAADLLDFPVRTLADALAKQANQFGSSTWSRPWRRWRGRCRRSVPRTCLNPRSAPSLTRWPSRPTRPHASRWRRAWRRWRKALSPEQAAGLFDSSARTLADALATQTEAAGRQRMVASLTALAKSLQPEQAANLLANALAKETDALSRGTLVEALSEVGKFLPPERAAYMLANALAKETYWAARPRLARAPGGVGEDPAA